MATSGLRIVDTVRMFSLSLTKMYEFDVGTVERHRVRIEKHRAALFAGFRPQPVFGYVDNVLVARSQGPIGT